MDGKFPIHTIGRHWATFLQTWNQVAAILSVMSFMMNLGVFYAIVVKGWQVPLGVFILIAGAAFVGLVSFVLLVGNRAWYNYAKRMTDIDLLNKKVDSIISILTNRGDNE